MQVKGQKPKARRQNVEGGRSGRGRGTLRKSDFPEVKRLCCEGGYDAGEGLVVETRGGGVRGISDCRLWISDCGSQNRSKG